VKFYSFFKVFAFVYSEFVFNLYNFASREQGLVIIYNMSCLLCEILLFFHSASRLLCVRVLILIATFAVAVCDFVKAVFGVSLSAHVACKKVVFLAAQAHRA
jgi:hypothetical protein